MSNNYNFKLFYTGNADPEERVVIEQSEKLPEHTHRAKLDIVLGRIATDEEWEKARMGTGWKELESVEDVHDFIEEVHGILDLSSRDLNDWRGVYRADYLNGRAYWTLQISSRDMALLSDEELEAARAKNLEDVLNALTGGSQTLKDMLSERINSMYEEYMNQEGTHDDDKGMGFYL